MDNISSIIKNGILSHNLARKLKGNVKDISNQKVQRRRKDKTLPNGNLLHDYANLFFNPRNATMYSLKTNTKINFDELCIIAINKDILQQNGIYISNTNASKDSAEFYTRELGLLHLDYDIIFADNWNIYDYEIKEEIKGKMCAEVLVPTRVHASYIEGIIVSYDHGGMWEKLQKIADENDLELNSNPYLFFR